MILSVIRGLTIVVAVTAVWIDTASAQLCPSADQCREGGSLLHNPNSNGTKVWTTPCKPVTDRVYEDPICNEIATCDASGGFGRFLKAVTFQCKVKHFGGYYGLDGMTFGILDWTSTNLPGILKAYQLRSSGGYEKHFSKFNLPTNNGCIDPKWVCNANRQAALMCDASWKLEFSDAIKSADFRKAEMDFAMLQYEQRVKRFAFLGLKTEYGNTAMAVLANNLVNKAACHPRAWKAACSARKDERSLVDCMLESYAENACRGGGVRISQERVTAIKTVFAHHEFASNILPKSKDVAQCVTRWEDK